MASYTLMDVIEVFPVATEVGAYEAANWRTAGLPPRGAPQGSATTTATVDAGGELAFTGLAAGTPYFAAAQVSGTWRYQGFTAPDDTTPSGLDARMDAAEASLISLGSTSLPDAAVVVGSAPFITGRFRLRDFWTARDFGATGNGDDFSMELLEGIHETRDANRTLIVPAGVYGVSDQLVNAGDADVDSGYASLALRGEGSGVTRLESSLTTEAMFQAAGDTSYLSGALALNGSAAKGDQTLSLNTTLAGGVAVGDILHISDPAQIFYGGSSNTAIFVAGEQVRVKQIITPGVSGQIKIYGHLDFAYPVGTSYWCKPRNIPLVRLEGFTVEQIGLGGGGSLMTSLSCVERFEATDIETVGFSNDTFVLGRVNSARILACRATYHLNDASLGGQTPYFVNAQDWTQNVLVFDCEMHGGRHLFTTGGSPTAPAPAHCRIAHCTATETDLTPFDTHPAARSIVFSDCEAHNIGSELDGSQGSGFQIRGINCGVVDCKVFGAAYGVSMPFGADGSYVRGLDTWNLTGAAVYVVSSNNVRIRDVVARAPLANGLLIEHDADFPTMTGLQVHNFEVEGNPSSSAFTFEVHDSSFVLRDLRAPSATTKFGGAAAVAALAAYTTPGEVIKSVGGPVPGGTTSSIKILSADSLTTFSTANSARGAFYFDPAKHAVPGKTLKLRMRGVIAPGTVAPGTDLTVRLRGVSIAAAMATTVNSVVTDSATGALSAAITASGPAVPFEATFDAPVAGLYAVSVEATATTAPSSDLLLRVNIEPVYV